MTESEVIKIFENEVIILDCWIEHCKDIIADCRTGTGGRRMSDDLISRKAVLEILYDISSRNYGSLFGYGINRACDVIEHVETAFCKEKVIKELKKCADNSYDMWCAIDSEQDFGEAMAYKNAIKIVEKGGIEA